MSRKAWRVAYIEGVDNVLGSTTFYGESRQDAETYATALFAELEGGIIQVDETQNVGVPDDDQLREWAAEGTLSPAQIEAMRVPGVNG